MKILHVCDTESWDIVAYQALHLASRLSALGHRTAVLCPKTSRLFSECAKLRVTAIPLTMGARLGLVVPVGWDVVNFYNPSALTPLLLKKVRSMSRVFVSQYRLGNMKAFERLSEAQEYVDLFLGGCNAVQEEFYSAGILPSRIFMLPPCISLGRWESAMLIKKTMPPKPPFKVGTVTMDPTLKEQELFMMMAKEVLNALPDTHFMMVGIKNEELRKFARALDISHKLDILSERNDMPEVMAMMNLYVKTSLSPGLSMSYIEAQASGVPCVIPRQQGLADFTINECNGVVVNPGDILECARAVVRLINEPQTCRGMADMAYNYISNNMSVPVVGNLLASLYEDALLSP